MFKKNINKTKKEDICCHEVTTVLIFLLFFSGTGKLPDGTAAGTD